MQRKGWKELKKFVLFFFFGPIFSLFPIFNSPTNKNSSNRLLPIVLKIFFLLLQASEEGPQKKKRIGKEKSEDGRKCLKWMSLGEK